MVDPYKMSTVKLPLGLPETKSFGPKRKCEEGSHVARNGCQWAVNCEQCPWTDCITGKSKRCEFSSDEGRRERIVMARMLRGIGKTEEQIGMIMGLSAEVVHNYMVGHDHDRRRGLAKQYAGDKRVSDIKLDADKKIAEFVAKYPNVSVTALAELLAVSPWRVRDAVYGRKGSV